MRAELNSVQAGASQYFTINTAHRKKKIQNIVYYFENQTDLQSYLLRLTPYGRVQKYKWWCSFPAVAVLLLQGRASDTRPFCAWCELPHWLHLIVQGGTAYIYMFCIGCETFIAGTLHFYFFKPLNLNMHTVITVWQINHLTKKTQIIVLIVSQHITLVPLYLHVYCITRFLPVHTPRP